MIIIAEISRSSNIPAQSPPIATGELGGGQGSGKPGNVETPLSNTGLKIHSPIQAGIDYITLCFPAVEFNTVISLTRQLETASSEIYTTHEYGRFVGVNYSHSATSPSGGMILWSLPGEDGAINGRLRIALAGKTLARIPYLALWPFVNYSFSLGAHVTRIDFKADDYGKLASFDDILTAREMGNYSGFKNMDEVKNIRASDRGGHTLYLGSRSGDKLLRYYDCLPVHGLDCYRWELEMKDDKAQMYASILFGIPFSDSDSVAAFIGASIVGSVKFADRSSGKPIARCPLLPWWDRLCQEFGTIKLSLPSPKPTIKTAMSWVSKQVKTTLAMIVDAIKAANLDALTWRRYLENLIDDGRRNYNDRHFAILAGVYQELDNPMFQDALSDMFQLGDSVPVSV